MSPFYTPCGGTLSPYLIGSFDRRISGPGNPAKYRQTIIQLINPTSEDCSAAVALFNHIGRFPPCGKQIKVPANGLVEVSITGMEPRSDLGVIKVACFKTSPTPTTSLSEVPSLGLVGFQRQFFGGECFSESPLQPVPVEILMANYAEELKRILNACNIKT